MLPSVIIHHDPEGINKREIIVLKSGDRLLDFLIKNYGSYGFSVPTSIYFGDCIKENELDQSDYKSINIILKDNDIINIVHRPQGIEEVVAIVIAIISVVLSPDISPPPIPDNPNFPKTNESPNNRLTGQTNIARPLGRIPDIYGRMRVFPDLGARTVTQFINHIKQVTEYLIIGRGQYSLSDIKSGETLIENISGSTLTTYNPYEIIPELINAVRSNEVNGQVVEATNENVFEDFSATMELSSSSMIAFGQSGVMAPFESILPGGLVTLSGTTNGDDGTYVFVSYTLTITPLFDGSTLYTSTVIVEETFNGQVSGLIDISLSSGAGNNIIGPFVVPLNTEEVWIDLHCPRGLADRSTGSSIGITISLDIILDELDDNSLIVATKTIPISLSDNTLDERFYTFKIGTDNPGNSYQCSVERNSLTINNSSYYDTVKWTGLSGIKKELFFDQGDVTSIIVETTAEDRETGQRKFNTIATRKLKSYNTSTQLVTGSDATLIDATATFTASSTLTVVDSVDPDFSPFTSLTNGDKFSIGGSTAHDTTYTYVSGVLVAGIYTVTVSETTVAASAELMNFRIHAKLVATAKMADALFNHLSDAKIGNKITADIDLQELYTIQSALDSGNIYNDSLGRFSYSFSSEKSSVKDELITIANSCRVFVRKIGNSIEFGRDEIRNTRVTLFNSRNKKPKSENKTIRLQKPSGFDGIELQWIYEDTGESFTYHFPADESALNPKKIDAAGIRNHRQAWNRAKIEFNKLKLQRESVEITVTKEGLHLKSGDRVANADGTDITTQSGEIKSISTLTIETFDPIDFKGNPNATVIFRDENGVSSEENTVTPRGDGINGFILSGATTLTLRIRGDLSYQVGTLYTFTLQGESKIKEYIVQKIDPKDEDYVKINLTNYNSAVYSPDTETPPSHETGAPQFMVAITGVSTSLAVSNVGLTGAKTVAIIGVSSQFDVGTLMPVPILLWNAAPTGTYFSEGVIGSILQASLSINFFTSGGSAASWETASFADTNGSANGSGVWRNTTDNNTIDFEIKIDSTGNATALGGITFGVWTAFTGTFGAQVGTTAFISPVNDTLTVEIRQITDITNTTGAATFTIEARKS